MALSKEQKILNKFERVLKLDYAISIEHNLTEEQLKHIQNYTHARSCGAVILKYRKPKNLQTLYEMICDCLSYGKKNTIEKFISMYGEELGKQKYEDTNASKAITLDKMIAMYGQDEGQVRWESYCDKQAVSNTFEYKQEKHGWTKEQFDEYNNSRAVTLDNLTKRHGDEKGTQIFNDYCDKQRVAGITREYFIATYGETDGMEKYVNMLIKKGLADNRTSKTADLFFNNFITHSKCVNSEFEYPIYSYEHDSVFVYDYINHNLKICIEFNGVYWHMKPSMYKSDDIHPTKVGFVASEIWKRDEDKKIAFLKKYPYYQYITVWEDEAYHDHTKVGSPLNETYMMNFIKSILEKDVA